MCWLLYTGCHKRSSLAHSFVYSGLWHMDVGSVARMYVRPLGLNLSELGMCNHDIIVIYGQAASVDSTCVQMY